MGGTDTVMAANGSQYMQRRSRCRPHQEQSSCRSRYSSTIRFNHSVLSIISPWPMAQSCIRGGDLRTTVAISFDRLGWAEDRALRSPGARL